jgi:uncharacterized protein YecT (DUF1311 family)
VGIAQPPGPARARDRPAAGEAAMQKLILAALGLLAAAPALAGPYEDPEYVACRDKSTVDAVDCLKAYTAEWDKRLNQAYTAAMALQTPDQKNRLRTVQVLWIQ